jgi:hypothetical protein
VEKENQSEEIALFLRVQTENSERRFRDKRLNSMFYIRKIKSINTNTMNKLKSTIALASIIAFSFACEQKAKESDEGMNQEGMEMQETTSSDAEKIPTSNASITFSDQSVTEIVNAYLTLKDELVATDGEKASTAAKNLVSVLERSEIQSKESLKAEVGKIANSTDPAVQRVAFDLASQQIIVLAKSGTLTEGKLYKQYCPMAKNNEGAFWLSASDQIRNPYFGDKMLKCGSVEEEI